MGQLMGGQFAEFIVNKRQELLASVRIATIDGGKDASDFDQGRTTTLAGGSVFLTIAVAIG